MRLQRKHMLSFTISVGLLLAIGAGGAVRAEEASTIETLQQPELPIGSVGGEVHADPFTGAATMSIPLEFPSGRNGIQPNLNLVYMSGSGNGWVGMGWKLELGSVERQVRYGLSYSANDFVARMSGANSELVLAPAPAPANEFRAKIERSFVRFRKLSAGDGQPYFEATDKKGVRYFFGQTSASRMADSANQSRIFKWLLDRIEDRDGNYMVATYLFDQGQVYLTQINYTGNGTTAPTSAVKFHLEDRTDSPSMFTTNYVVKTAKRLKTIEVQAAGVVLRAYKISYEQPPSPSNSVISSVTQFGKDATINATGTITNEATATRLPPISMEWSVVPNTFGTGGGYTGLWLGSGACSNVNAPLIKTRYGDFNGDGKTDILCEDRLTGTYYVALSSGELFNNGGGWTGTWLGNGNAANGACGLPPFQYRDPAHPVSPPYTDGIRTQYADFNGDGKTDLLCEDRYTGTYYVALSDGTKFGNGAGYTGTWLGNGSYAGGACAFPNPVNSVWAGRLNTRYADFNGDGKTDLLCEDRNTGTYYMALSDGTKFGSGGGWTGTWLGNGNAANGACGPALNVATRYGDFNGDGKTDLLCEDRNTGTYYVALSDGTQFGNGGGWTGTWLGNGNIASGACIAGTNITTQYGDFNGDGKIDLLCEDRNSGTYYVALSDGTKFGSGGGYTQEWMGNGNAANGACVAAANVTPQYGDFNGDGKVDLLCENRNTGTYYVALSDGTRFGNGGGYTGTWLGNGDPASGACGLATGLFTRYGDFNGDGKTDFLCEDRTNGNYWVAKSGNQSTMGAGQLLSVSNGVGGRRAITYKPSTRYVNSQLPYSIQTVSSIVSCDNWNGSACVGNSATTNYDYSGGYHYFAEREFRGFNYVKVIAPSGPSGEQAITETWFHQGNDLAVDSNTPYVSTGYTKGMPYRSKVTDATGKIYSETTTAYVADNDLIAPWFTPQSQIDTYLCESGTCATHTRTTFEYDHQYGNLSLENHYGDLANSNDDRAIYRTYSDNITDWIVGLPTRESHYNSISTVSINLVAHKTFFYDGTGGCATPNGTTTPTKGHLTKSTNWLSVTGAEYDVWGNVTCTRDANGNVSTVTYDSTKTFPKTTTNPLGHVTTTQYYGVDGQVSDKGLYGQVKSVTDPNGQITVMEYDAFGRKTKVTAPDGGITSLAYNYGTGFSVGTQHVLSTTSGTGIITPLSSLNFFDGLGRSIRKEATGPDGKVIVTEVQYDSRGAVRQTSLPYFKTIETVVSRWSTSNHDALGRTVRVDSPDGTRNLFCFSDWVTVSIDAADHRKRITKDAYGRTIRIDEYQATFSTCTTDVGSPYATTLYQYDSRDNLISVTDAKGNLTTITYDEQSRKKNMRDPDLGYWIYGYDSNGNLTDQTDAKGQVTWFRYDSLNRQVQKDYGTQKALGAGDVRYTYDGTTNNRKGRLQQRFDATGTVVFQYDSMGRVLRSDRTLDGVTYTTQNTYDGLSRLLTITYPGTPAKTISYTYNGPVLDKVFEGTTTYIQYSNYNALGQAGTSSYGNGVSTTKSYSNASNSVCSQVNFRLCTLVTNGPGSSGGGGVSTTYSSLGDFSGIQGSHGWYYLSSTGSQLNWNGSYWIGTDGYISIWNDGGHPGNSTDAVRRWVAPSGGSIQITGNTFDGDTSCGTDGVVVTIKKNGAVLWTQTIAAGNTTGFTFNLSNTVAASDQIDFVTNKLTTSSCDNTVFTPTIVLTTAGGGSGPLLNGTYTAPVSTVNLSTEGTVDWTHWGMSTATSFNHKSGVTSQISNFSAVGGGVAGQYSDNLVGYTWTGGTPTASASNSTTGLYIVGVNKGFQFTVPADTTQRTVKVYVSAWGAQGKMEALLSDSSAGGYSDTSLTDPGLNSSGAARVYTFTYRAASANQTLTLRWTNLVQNDPAGGNVTLQAATLIVSTGGSSGTGYQDLRYAYALNGNVNDIYDNLVAGGAGDQHLSYDGIDRLTLANGPYGTNSATASLTYTYDEVGNLTFNTQVGTYAYPTSGPSSTRPHAVTSAGINTYSYDANGNLTTGAGRTFTYNLENKPLTITISGQTTTFVYDGGGGRMKKIAGTTTTRYISKLYECDNTSCSRMIFANGQRIATIGASGSVYYYHNDHLGSSSVITDSFGAKVQAVTYFPYGATRTNISTANPAIDVAYKYTGKELDTSTNLYYYDARYYDPTLARFLTADTTEPSLAQPQDLNHFSYVRNNPFKYVDPSGNTPLLVAPAVSGVYGAIAGGTSGFIGGYQQGMTQAIVGGIGGAIAGAATGVFLQPWLAANAGTAGGVTAIALSAAGSQLFSQVVVNGWQAIGNGASPNSATFNNILNADINWSSIILSGVAGPGIFTAGQVGFQIGAKSSVHTGLAAEAAVTGLLGGLFEKLGNLTNQCISPCPSNKGFSSYDLPNPGSVDWGSVLSIGASSDQRGSHQMTPNELLNYENPLQDYNSSNSPEQMDGLGNDFFLQNLLW